MALEVRKKFFETLFGHNEGVLWLAAFKPKREDINESFKDPINVGFKYHGKYTREIEKFITDWQDERNVYFSVNLTDFDKKLRRQKVNMTRSTMAYSDLDTCNPKYLKVPPTIVTLTSYGRWHGFWVFERVQTAKTAEDISKRIAVFHRDQGADGSGWDIGQLLRVPMTKNHNKLSPQGEPLTVDIVNFGSALYRPSDFDRYPKLTFAVVGNDYKLREAQPEDTRPYRELSVTEKIRIEEYVERAVSDEKQKLEELSKLDLGEKYKYYKRDGKIIEFSWDDGCMWVARCLVELAAAPWNRYTEQQAYKDFILAAPTDERFTNDALNAKWCSALGAIKRHPEKIRPYPMDHSVLRIFRTGA